MTHRIFALIAALGSFVASVPAAAPFTDNYAVSGFYLQSSIQDGVVVAANGFDYSGQTLTTEVSKVATLGPGITSPYSGFWKKKGSAYSVDFSKSYQPQIAVSFLPAIVKKVAYHLIDMHPFDAGVSGNVSLSLKVKLNGMKAKQKATGVFFGARV